MVATQIDLEHQRGRSVDADVQYKWVSRSLGIKLYSHPHDGSSTLSTSGSEVLFVIPLTEELSLLLDGTDPDQWTPTVGVRAHEVIWTPLLVQCSYKWSSVVKLRIIQTSV